MKRSKTLALALISAAFLNPLASAAPSLSPGNWPVAERERLEKLESLTWSPLKSQPIASSKGLVSATVSPLAAYAGAEALRHGGTAADAAAATALTQIATQLGSVVSYAGVFTMLYYEAETKQVYSLDAGFNSYRAETDPLTIPQNDLGALAYGRVEDANGSKGRTTLVPGFMAGLEAMHKRFGTLPFPELFAPAIWYCEAGIDVSPTLAGFFQMRKDAFARTPEGQAFLAQSGGDVPRTGERLTQADLAATLRAVASDGAQFMYTGAWAEAFVSLVQREGGKATLDDLRNYQPIWSEPYKTEVFGHTVYVNGPPHYGAYALIAGLQLAEARQLQQRGPYWMDTKTLLDLSRISQLFISAPALSPTVSKQLSKRGIASGPEALLGPEFAQSVAPLLEMLKPLEADRSPKHSNAIAVIDRFGNIAVVTHTINAVVWGTSGIVVGGIPLPDSAGFQQQVLAAIKPGDRVPHQIVDTISFKNDTPVLATASIGASLLPETVRTLVGVLGQTQDLATLMKAPPLLTSFPTPDAAGKIPDQLPVTLSSFGYDAAFLDELRDNGIDLLIADPETVSALRGTLAAIAIDSETGERAGADQEGIMVFNTPE